MKKPIIGLVTFLAVAAAGAAVAYTVSKRHKNGDIKKKKGDYVVNDLESILVDEVGTVEQPPADTANNTIDADSIDTLESFDKKPISEESVSDDLDESEDVKVDKIEVDESEKSLD